MSIVLLGATSGSITLQEPAVAGTNTLSLPAVTGTFVVAGQNSAITAGTAVSASGTSVDFTSIPSWVKRVTVNFAGVSTNGTSAPQIQLGDSGGIETTGYLGSNTIIAGGTAQQLFTSGFGIGVNTANWAATVVVSGAITITLLDSSTNTWAASGSVGRSDVASTYFTSGSKSLSATLDRVRITTVNGTDTFDAGTINILYE